MGAVSIAQSQDHGGCEIHRHGDQPDRGDLSLPAAGLEKLERHGAGGACDQNTLGAANRDGAEKAASLEQLYHQRINIERQQPEEPNQKSQENETQYLQPKTKGCWNELGKEQITDQVNCRAGDPRFPAIVFSPLGTAAAKQRQQAREREIEAR